MIIWYFFIIILASASASRFWPRLTSLFIGLTLPPIAELGRPDCSPEYVDAFALSEEQSRINNAEAIHLFFCLGNHIGLTV